LASNLNLIKNIFNNDSSKLSNFLGYSWGDHLNDSERRKLFIEHGLNGIIYDRIDENRIIDNILQANEQNKTLNNTESSPPPSQTNATTPIDNQIDQQNK
jgi:hypothetical protein